MVSEAIEKSIKVKVIDNLGTACRKKDIVRRWKRGSAEPFPAGSGFWELFSVMRPF